MLRLPPVAVVVLLVIFAGCASGPEDVDPLDDPAAAYGAIEGTGTARMAAILHRIRDDARQDPLNYFHLNLRSAEVLAESLKTAPQEKQVAFHYARANNLLYGGDTQQAIEELAQLIQDVGASPRTITRQTKPLFDLLAIAYMRMGEQQNCIDNHSSASCILPIRGEGVHTKRAGSERAIGIYDQMLRRFRRDLQSRWLLNIAHMTLGQYPEAVPSPVRIAGITEPADTRVRRFHDVAMDVGAAHNALAGGLSVDDFNNDGFLDIFATSYGLGDAPVYYQNDGAGGFVDRTEAAGLDSLLSGLNAMHADYDNDGDTDIFVTRGAWLGRYGQHPNSLFRNNGDGTFTDVTFQAGLDAYHPTQVASWQDVNGDGWIDLFVGNESNAEVNFITGQTTEVDSTLHASALYLNNGDGTFTDRAADWGLNLNAYVKGATWGDVNTDGRPDLYVSVLGGPNRLYVNQGDGFVDRASEAGVREPIYSFPTWFWDIDNDGDDDLFVSGYDVRHLSRTPVSVAAEHAGLEHNAELPRLYENNGDGTFTDVTRRQGLDTVLFTMGSNFGDLDNDGFLDFYAGTGAPDLRSLIPNRTFHNDGGDGFTEVTYESGTGHIQKGHSVAFADFDRDGDQDIYSVMGGAVEGDVFPNVLFENPGHGNQWITLHLEGRTANRSAIGARIALTVRQPDGSTRPIHRTVTTGGSFGAASLQQEIGLGRATRIDTLRITWPTAAAPTQTVTDLDVNQTLRIVEGESPEGLDRPPVPFREGEMQEHGTHDGMTTAAR